MEIRTESQDNVTVITLSGRLDGLTASPTYEKILPLVTEGCRLVLDMKNCDYISSAGLRTILMLGKQIKKGGGWGVMANLQEEVKDVMEMTGFDNVFQNYNSVAAAFDAVKED